MPKTNPARAAKRLRGLLHQLTAEAGSQAAAAKRLAMKPGVYSKTVRAERSGDAPSGEWFLAAHAYLGLPIDYFTVPGPDEIDYRAFLRDRGVTAPTLTPADLAAVSEQLEAVRDELRRVRATADSEESGTRPKVKR